MVHSVAELVTKGVPPVERLATGIDFLDKATSGGFVVGKVGILYGDSGAGKTTLAVQICAKLDNGLGTAIVSLEEGSDPVVRMAMRSKASDLQTDIIVCPDRRKILALFREGDYRFVVIDSLSVMKRSFARRTNELELKRFFEELRALCVEKGMVVVFVGRFTKSGVASGSSDEIYDLDFRLSLRSRKPGSTVEFSVEKHREGGPPKSGIRLARDPVDATLVEAPPEEPNAERPVSKRRTQRPDRVRGFGGREGMEDSTKDEEPREDVFKKAFADLSRMELAPHIPEILMRPIHVLAANMDRAKHGKPQGETTLHTAFLGPPGTGKTTVARIFADLLFGMGFLQQRLFVEVSGADLIAGYVGQTALKTTKVLESALGGLLFIDEAYQLDPGKDSGNGGSYKREAVETILKFMEDHRNEMVIVFAGYRAETLRLFNANPGFVSRVKYNVDFPGYSIETLVHMFRKLVEEKQYSFEDGALDRVGAALRKLKASRGDKFGNAREVRVLFEKACENQARRFFFRRQESPDVTNHSLPIVAGDIEVS